MTSYWCKSVRGTIRKAWGRNRKIMHRTPTTAEIARIVEETRLRRMLELDTTIASLKMERECLASQVRNEMMRDGVQSSKLPGVGTFKLYPPKAVHPCESCMAQFGFGKGQMDPYLGVYAAKDIAA